MNIAELFVKLGVKGGDDSNKKVGNLDKGLKKVRKTSLATKAAIIGVIFGFERLMSNSAKTGVGLNQFARSTGLSTKELQKWEHAGMKARVTQEEIRAGFIGVQTAISNMLRGGGAPKGYGMLTALVEDFDENKITDTFYMMQKIQELAQKTDAATARDLVTSFGISQNMFGAMRENAFAAENLKGAFIYTNKEINNLKKIEATWANVYKNMENAMGQLTAKHGMKIAGEIDKLIPKFLKLANVIVRLAEKFQFFDRMGKVLNNIGNSLTWLEAIPDLWTSAKQELGAMANLATDGNTIQMLDFRSQRAQRDLQRDPTNQRFINNLKKIQFERVQRGLPANVKVNNNFNISGTQSPKAVADEVSKKVNQTYRSKITSQEN